MITYDKLIYNLGFNHLTSRETAELSDGRGSEPECRHWKQSEAAGGAEGKEPETEKHAAAGENPEEDERGKAQGASQL